MNFNQLAAICFFLNGAFMVAMQWLVKLGWQPYTNAIFGVMYLTSFVMAIVLMRSNDDGKKRAVSTFVGFYSGLAGAMGLNMQMASLNHLNAHVCFPLVSGGTSALIVLCGWAFFREKIGKPGVLGIIAALAAIVLLGG